VQMTKMTLILKRKEYITRSC